MCKKIFFTVIIPTYNSIKTITRSVNSVLNQSFQNFEILIVDDGSNKKTQCLQKKIFKNNNKIKLYSRLRNFGVSNSRNFAMKKANGDFLIFLDSDDYLLSNYLENIYNILKKKNIDVVIALNQKIHKKFTDMQLYEQLFTKNNLSYYCWNYVINKKFIFKNNIFFENIKVFEDQLFIFKIFQNIRNYTFYKKKFIIHTQNFQSLGRLTNHYSCKAYALIVNRISRIIIKKHENYLIKFFKKKLIDSINFFGLYSLTCNNKQIKKYSNLISKTKYFRQELKIRDLNTKVLLYINKNLQLLNIILKNKLFSHGYKTHIYSLGLNSRILIKLLTAKKIKIYKIIDNNKLFHKKIYQNVKISNELKNENNDKLILAPFELKYFIFKQKIYKVHKDKFIFFKFYKLSSILFK